MIDEVKKKFSLSYAGLSRQVGLGCTTLMRWKRRVARGQAAVGRRGPKKVAPLDLAALKEKIRSLDHGNRRSRGTGRVHRAYGSAISRRDLDRLVREVRQDIRRQRAAIRCQVTWLRANLAWALDDCEKMVGPGQKKLHLHNLTDLCSRYKLPPIASDSLACGEEVAGHLEYLFERFGAPLFCKRDNGGNLNHVAVNDVLAQARVIPLNSPPATARYNGAIEHTQGEFKSYLTRWHHKAYTVDKMVLLAETAAHDLNHIPRRCLSGKTACRAYYDGSRLRCTSRQRVAAYRWIRDLAADISTRLAKPVITPVAWRVAAKQWLLRKELITIRRPGKVSPYFSQKLCHN